ncbi:MAG: hypothetical protein ACRDHX_08530 [Chloroflexota bacterium]
MLLIVGYLLGIPPLLVLTRALKAPGARIGATRVEWRLVLLAEVAGMVLLAAGWLLRGDMQSTLVYGAWLVVVSFLWFRAERIHRV